VRAVTGGRGDALGDLGSVAKNPNNSSFTDATVSSLMGDDARSVCRWRDEPCARFEEPSFFFLALVIDVYAERVSISPFPLGLLVFRKSTRSLPDESPEPECSTSLLDDGCFDFFSRLPEPLVEVPATVVAALPLVLDLNGDTVPLDGSL